VAGEEDEIAVLERCGLIGLRHGIAQCLGLLIGIARTGDAGALQDELQEARAVDALGAAPAPQVGHAEQPQAGPDVVRRGLVQRRQVLGEEPAAAGKAAITGPFLDHLHPAGKAELGKGALLEVGVGIKMAGRGSDGVARPRELRR